MTLRRIKTIRSHTALANWIVEQSAGRAVGYLARSQVADIPSPYRYSPVVEVWEHEGKRTVWFETAHKRYEIFEVPAETVLFETEQAAEDHHIASKKVA